MSEFQYLSLIPDSKVFDQLWEEFAWLIGFSISHHVQHKIEVPVYKVIPEIVEKPVPYTVEKPYPGK